MKRKHDEWVKLMFIRLINYYSQRGRSHVRDTVSPTINGYGGMVDSDLD